LPPHVPGIPYPMVEASRGVWRFSAQPEEVAPARRAVSDFACAHGAIDIDALVLAVSEAVTNAVLHAYVDQAEPGQIEVVAERDPDDGVDVRVCDDGRGMQPRDGSPGIGAGLPLIATVCEHLDIETRPSGGTRLCMNFAAHAEVARG
jgi:serine/threonine-protein kinase RsbW